MDFSPLKFAENLLFSSTFSEKLTTTKLKVIATSYTFIGGVYFDERVNVHFRRIWAFYSVSSTALVCSACTFYLTDLTDYNSSTILTGCIPIFSTLTKTIYSMIIFRHRNEIKQVVDFLVDDDAPNDSSEPVDQVIELLIKIAKWLFGIYVGVVVVLMVYVPSDSVQFTNENVTTTRHVHAIRHFPMWCPFGNTTAVGDVVGIFQGMAIVPDMIFTMAGSAFFFAMVTEIYEKFISMCEQLATYSTGVFVQVEWLNAQQEEATEIRNTIVRRNTMYRLNLRRIGLMGVFYADFTRFMKRYQQLQRTIVLVMEFMQAYFSVHCLSVVGLGIVVTLLTESETYHWGVQLFGAAFTLCLGLSVCCLVGYLLAEMNEMVTRQVYEMPWYHMSSWYRATVNTFLTTVRQPLVLQVLKVFPLTRNVIAKGLSYVWSLVQILRAVRRDRRI